MANPLSIIDDDESISRSTKRLIESFAIRAAILQSPESSLGSDRAGETGCLVVDINMPGMDGLELQSRLVAAGYNVPSDFLSVCGDGSYLQGTQTGVVAFLGKRLSDRQSEKSVRSASGNKSKVPKLISIVDDDESVRRTTRLLVESFGFRAAVFESAEKILKSEGLDGTSCLIVDVQMPGMDGLQLQSQLAAMGHSIPIIFITAYDSKETRRRAIQAGAVAFLGKPFSDEQLLQTIQLALKSDKGGTETM
jgi:FixJ family two-component response regulator